MTAVEFEELKRTWNAWKTKVAQAEERKTALLEQAQTIMNVDTLPTIDLVRDYAQQLGQHIQKKETKLAADVEALKTEMTRIEVGYRARRVT